MESAAYYSKLYDFPAWDGLVPKLNDWLEEDPFGSEPADKLSILTTSTDWATNIGHPGPANTAEGEVFGLPIIPNMFARAARGELTPEQSVAEATAESTACHRGARKIAMVFQSYALYPHKTVLANIAFPLKAERMDRDNRNRKTKSAAALLGIDRLTDRKPRELSCGERQWVALACALVREPQVLLLDEPLSNLDAKLRASARDELKRFQQRVGTTTFYVTHDQAEAMGLGDRIAVMDKGTIRQLGKPRDVYDDPVDTFVATFIGSPPMNLVPRDGTLVGFRPEHFLPSELGSRDLITIPFVVEPDRVPVRRQTCIRDSHPDR